jgi:hypothetical protein
MVLAGMIEFICFGPGWIVWYWIEQERKFCERQEMIADDDGMHIYAA